MKQALVQTLDQGGNTYGQVSNPNDLMKAQGFVHERISGVVNDFINRSSRPEVVGFDQTLGAGTAFNMTVAKGRVYTQNGISYDRNTSTTVTFDAAHATLPRIDIVVAKIEDEVDAELDLIPFVRLRTPDEFADDVPAYAPANISAPTEKHWRVTVQIKKGTAAEQPSKPILADNEIPLYELTIPAALVNLSSAIISDVRGIVNTIRMLTDQYGQNQITLSELSRRLAALEDTGGQPIDLSQILGEVQSLEEILSTLLTRTSSAADLPELRYDPAWYPPHDQRSAMVQASGEYVSSHGYVDFKVGCRVNFGDAEVLLTPEGFVDPALNARYVDVGADPEHDQLELDLTLSAAKNIQSDGSIGFGARGAQLTPNRLFPAVAARSSRYIEIFGGTSADGGSALGDWHTYDTENDTLTLRTITGATIPNASTPAMFPYGDGTHVLVIASSNSNPGATQSFKVNCSTGVATAIAVNIRAGNVFGDLIAPGKIFVVALDYGVGALGTKFYEFSTTTHAFTELTTTGNIPGVNGVPINGIGQFAGGCYFRENQFIFFWDAGLKVKDFKTSIFDRTTLQWTEITVANSPLDYSDEPSQSMWQFRMANIGGRPTIVGGQASSIVYHYGEWNKSRIWEFTESSPVPALTGSGLPYKNLMTWKEVAPVNMPPKIYHGMASTLGSTSMPDGKAFVFAGYANGLNDTGVYGSTRAGLISTVYNGQTGISIAEGSTFAQFEIDPYTTSNWLVNAYYAGLLGSFTPQNVKLEASMDNGATWKVISPDLTNIGFTSTTPSSIRRLRITLYRNGANPPILTHLTEILNSGGHVEVEERTVIRIDSPEDDEFYAVHIDRLGRVTLTNTSNPPGLLPSTPSTCLLMLMIATSGAAPTLTPLINRRRPVYRVTGVKDAAADTAVDCLLAVPFRYFELRGVAASGKHYYRPPTQNVTTGASFRSQVHVLKTEVPEADTYEVVFHG